MHIKDHTYSDGVYNKKIVIVGPKAPPIGGVAIHIERVAKKLAVQNNMVHICDVTHKKNRIARYWYLIATLLSGRPDVVYYHTVYHHGLEFFCVIFCALFFPCTIVTVAHNGRYLNKKLRVYKRFFSWCLYNKLHTCVVIGDQSYQAYKRFFYTPDKHSAFYEKISLESPFLPPDYSKERFICQTYPLELNTFLALRSPILCTCAFKLVYHNDSDLYGFDQCIAMLNSIRLAYPKVGMVFALADPGDSVLYESFLAAIRNKKLESCVYVLGGQRRLWPLLRRADIFVRATLTDGYSVSVVEALECGASVVASDVCMRPSAAFLYKACDCSSLTAAVLHVLSEQFT